jgi:methyl-accepting chemotaxis protein
MSPAPRAGFAGLQESPQPLSRASADALLRRALKENSELIGIWTIWEPDAFDKNDAAYVNKPGHDATGRYVPYWNRGSGDLAVEPLVNYTTPGAGDYYLIVKQSNREAVLEPYVYKVAGKDVLMTSLVVPVRDAAGAFVGAVGVDLPLHTLSDRLAPPRLVNGYAASSRTAGSASAIPTRSVWTAHAGFWTPGLNPTCRW